MVIFASFSGSLSGKNKTLFNANTLSLVQLRSAASQLSTNLHANHILGYNMNKENQISNMKTSYIGKVEEPVDKIYFRQKDEINQYAVAL